MTIGFSTQVKGVPTNFPQMIWNGLHDLDEFVPMLRNGGVDAFNIALVKRLVERPSPIDQCKFHSIRAGKRWRVGMDIHMVVGNRTKNRFQFVPTIKVKRVQDIEIKWHNDDGRYVEVRIDEHSFYVEWDETRNRPYKPDGAIKILAEHDGFDSVTSFLKWFDKDFEGQIIHWTTDLKY